MKKILLSGALVLLSCLSLFGVSTAALTEKVTVAGTSFTIGQSIGGAPGGTTGTNTALKILKSNSASAQSSNLADTVNGPAFNDIDAAWVQSFPIKLFNKGTKTLDIVSGANYVSDPDTLRDDLFIEILDWNDSNNDGSVQDSEIGTSHGHDTILRMKNDTFPLGAIAPNGTKGYVLRFDGTGLSDANIGKNAIYDFTFTGVESASQ